VKKKVIVAMSGGVDSSVTAALLKEQGYEVEGMTMRLWKEDPGVGASEPGCRIPDHAGDARRVAEALDIPFTLVDMSDAFYSRIVKPFCDVYLDGKTPNPCVVCNQTLKFGLLLDAALEKGADCLATGHYARILRDGDRYSLVKAVNHRKDQSYFLFTLTQRQLSRVLFPLGEMTKEDVREQARRLNLPVAQKSESQDICFIPDGDYVSFLERQGSHAPEGNIVHVSGKVVGRHQGTYRYTIGQRRGLGIAWPEPLYVVRIDAPSSTVYVGERHHLAVDTLTLREVCWNIPEPGGPLEARCRIRYRHQESVAVILPGENRQATVRFSEPQQGVTPGQAAVFYQGDRVLGGGWIA